MRVVKDTKSERLIILELSQMELNTLVCGFARTSEEVIVAVSQTFELPILGTDESHDLYFALKELALNDTASN